MRLTRVSMSPSLRQAASGSTVHAEDVRREADSPDLTRVTAVAADGRWKGALSEAAVSLSADLRQEGGMGRPRLRAPSVGKYGVRLVRGPFVSSSASEECDENASWPTRRGCAQTATGSRPTCSAGRAG